MRVKVASIIVAALLSVGCGAKLSPERQAAIKLTQAVELGKRVRVTTQSFEQAKLIQPKDAKVVYGNLLNAQLVASEIITNIEAIELIGASPELVDKVSAGLDVLVILYPGVVKDVPVVEIKSKLLVILNQSQSLVKESKELFNGK